MIVRLALLLCVAVAPLGAASSKIDLLEQAVESWLGERDHWAFTQKAVEYDGEKPRERLERYDPSKAGTARWTLLAINGHTPTPEEHAAWARKKFRRTHRRFDSPIGDYFEFQNARVIAETAKAIEFEVPLRHDKNWLFQTDKVRVTVTVNKETRALEHLSADLREPMKVLLGIAKITDGALDLTFDENGGPDPGSAAPTGRATVTVSKFGERAEFTWSDFKRVPPTPSRSARSG